MILPEDGICYTYLMLLKQQRCTGCCRKKRYVTDFTHSVFWGLDTGGFICYIMTLSHIYKSRMQPQSEIQSLGKKLTFSCTVSVYYRTNISLTHDYSELTEFLIKFYVCILFSHKLKSCVCPPPQKLQQEYFAFLGKAGVLFKTKTLNYKDFAFTPSVLFLHILYIIKFSVFPFSVAF